MDVLVVGSGKLAQEILGALQGAHIKSVRPWGEVASGPLDGVFVVHAGSGRELAAVHAYCSQNYAPLIELATSGDYDGFEPSFPLIVCPNTNVLMLQFLAMVRRAGGGFRNYERSILESHQSTKTSEAGTARSLAHSLGIGFQQIESIRDPVVQQTTLGIPAGHLARHAFHRIHIQDASASITLESRVLGPAPYAVGLAEILRILGTKDLAARVYDVVDFF